MLNRLVDDIVKWHILMFPDVTEESQMEKLKEELKEYTDSKDDLEIADVLIVSLVLHLRFGSLIGKYIFECFENKVGSGKANRIVAEKMKINSARKWEFVNGVYHHKESV